MKKLIIFIGIAFFCSCEDDDLLEKYHGNYSGQKVSITHYREYDPIFNQYVSKSKFDTTICKLDITPNCCQLYIKEFNGGNILLKNWRGIEVNNIGELAYFGTDSAGYGIISVDSLYYKISFASPIPPDNIIETSDTLFYSYYYYATRQ